MIEGSNGGTLVLFVSDNPDYDFSDFDSFFDNDPPENHDPGNPKYPVLTQDTLARINFYLLMRPNNTYQ
jgi:hypothetical protein